MDSNHRSLRQQIYSLPPLATWVFPLKLMVGVTGLEPAAPWSQTTYATICATPRPNRHILLYIIIFDISIENAKIL